MKEDPKVKEKEVEWLRKTTALEEGSISVGGWLVTLLRETEAAITRAKEATVEHPDSPSAAANLRSLEKRREDLLSTLRGN